LLTSLFSNEAAIVEIKRILGENIDSLKMLSDRRRAKTGAEPWEYVLLTPL
jgi:hypothetical protein